MGVVGAGIKAFGILQQGQAASNAANYQAQVAKNNEIIAKQNAEYSAASGVTQAATTSMKSAAVGARIKTAQAANNIDVNTGSAVDVQASQRVIGKLDTETVLNNAELQSYGYRAQASNFAAEAELSKMKGEQAKVGSYFSAARIMDAAPSCHRSSSVAL